jgi:hypothetical protein
MINNAVQHIKICRSITTRLFLCFEARSAILRVHQVLLSSSRYKFGVSVTALPKHIVYLPRYTNPQLLLGDQVKETVPKITILLSVL